MPVRLLRRRGLEAVLPAALGERAPEGAFADVGPERNGLATVRKAYALEADFKRDIK
jgi:hypothetical protein